MKKVLILLILLNSKAFAGEIDGKADYKQGIWGFNRLLF